MHQPSTRREFLRFVAGAAAPLILPRNLWARSMQSKPTFAPPIGVCTSVANAAILRRAGVDYLEVSVTGCLVPDRPEAAFADDLKAARACGLQIRAANGFLPASLKCTGPQPNTDGVLAYAKVAFERAQQLGIGVIVFGSAGARTPPDGFDLDKAREQLIALLKQLAPLAQARSVVVALEPLQKQETRFINTVTEGAKIVRAVAHANVRLVADIFHMLRMEEPPDALRRAGELVCHVHIAEKRERTPPGVDRDDFRDYFRALAELRYTGGISIECGWKDLAQQLPAAVKTLREQMAQVANG